MKIRVAISYVLKNSDSFQKLELLRFIFRVFSGKGMYNSPFWGLILMQLLGPAFFEGTFLRIRTSNTGC